MNLIAKIIGLTAALLLACSPVFADQEAYRIDDSHSFANWSLRHVAAKPLAHLAILLEKSSLIVRI